MTLKDMLGKTAKHHPEEWDWYLPSGLMASNSSVHSATGYSPIYLLFGRSIRLPLEVPVNRPKNAIRTHNYAVDLVAGLEYAYALARAKMHLLRHRAKDRSDAEAVEKETMIGDLVRVFQPKPKKGVPFKFHLLLSDPRELWGFREWSSRYGTRNLIRLKQCTSTRGRLRFNPGSRSEK